MLLVENHNKAKLLITAKCGNQHSERSISSLKRSAHSQMPLSCEEALEFSPKLRWRLPLLNWRRHVNSFSDKRTQPRTQAWWACDSHAGQAGKPALTPFLTVSRLRPLRTERPLHCTQSLLRLNTRTDDIYGLLTIYSWPTTVKVLFFQCSIDNGSRWRLLWGGGSVGGLTAAQSVTASKTTGMSSAIKHLHHIRHHLQWHNSKPITVCDAVNLCPWCSD